jgi:pilus assembly protein CpaF
MTCLVLDSPAGKRTVELAGGVKQTLGRDPACDLHVADPQLSRRHLEIQATATGIRFQDLGSANGTFLNGERVVQGELRPGASLRAGSVSLQLAEGASDARPTEQETAAFHAALLDQLDLRALTDEQLGRPAFREQVRVQAARLAAERFPQAAPDARARFVEAVLHEVFGLGPLDEFLADDSVSEIMVNAPDEVWVERDGRLERTATRFSSDAAVRRIIDRIVAPLGRRIDESSPLVDARLADGSRVNAIIPPVALKGATLTIRKFRRQAVTPENLLAWGSIDEAGLALLRDAVVQRKNIIVSGGTGAGKTTLLNLLGGFIDPGERIVTLEDAAELQLPQPHVVRLESRPPNLEGSGAITIRDLLKNALRMRPDRILVGECRGGEALDMLQAMNTGHDGSLSTVHANTTQDALRRLETLVLFAGADLPHRAVREQVACAIHLVVQQSRLANGKRRVTEITAVDGLRGETYATESLWTAAATPEGEKITL